MRNFLVRFLFFFLSLLPTLASAAPLDDYYLSKFGMESKVVKALSSVALAEGSKVERCRTDLYRNLRSDFNSLQPETRKVLGKYLLRPILSGQTSETSAPSYVSSGGHFNIHYTTTGEDAPDLADLDGDQVPDWVEKVAATFEHVYGIEIGGMGYKAPTTRSYDVYLRNLVQRDQHGMLIEPAYYGVTASDAIPASPSVSASSSIEIDKSFSDPVLTVDGKYTPEQMLQVTAAHEFHHAIQFSYNYYFQFWYAEVTATWMENEVYENVDQLYGYLKHYLPKSSSVSLDAPRDGETEYGRWIFNRYMVENHNSISLVRMIWERLSELKPWISPTDSDGHVLTVPVLESVLGESYRSSLAMEFFGLAKRTYSGDWASRTNVSLIPEPTVISTYSSYPVNSSSLKRPSVTLPQYTYGLFKLQPSSTVADLTVTVSKTSGVQVAVFKKVAGVITEIDGNPDGCSYTVRGFGSLNPSVDEVVLLIANTADVYGLGAGFSTDGSTVDPSVSIKTGGGGCFIATAAYGSYLHPKVAELRSFRDRYLMTNAPGRIFVSLYYRVSPPIAEVISQHEWMKAGVRVLLLPLVLSVEHPVAAAALLLLALGSAAWRAARRGRGVQLRRLSA